MYFFINKVFKTTLGACVARLPAVAMLGDRGELETGQHGSEGEGASRPCPGPWFWDSGTDPWRSLPRGGGWGCGQGPA